MLWQRSVDPLLSLTLSPQGNYLALLTADNRLALWSAQTGKSDWAIGGVTAHDAVVSDQSGAVLIYDDMNRIDRRVTIYRATIPLLPAKPASTPKTSQPTKTSTASKPVPPQAVKKNRAGKADSYLLAPA